MARTQTKTTKDPMAIPPFLVRPRRKVVEVVEEPAEPLVPKVEKFSTNDELYMCGLHQNEGGYRRYLCVRETDTHAHLLHVPTLEHVEMTLRQLKDNEVDHGPVPVSMIERLNEKSAQWDAYGFRYSRALVNEALQKLGAPPLPAIPTVPDYLLPKVKPAPKKPTEARPPRIIEAPKPQPKAAQPAQLKKAQRKGTGVVERIAALLLRKEGCTRQDVMTLTGWGAVSMQQQARAAGIGLRIEGIRGNMRYYGIAPEGHKPEPVKTPAPVKAKAKAKKPVAKKSKSKRK